MNFINDAKHTQQPFCYTRVDHMPPAQWIVDDCLWRQEDEDKEDEHSSVHVIQ
jgi:hypothetical protein